MTERPADIRVECYAGYRSEETPRRFFLGNRRVEVLDILDRWLSPEHRYFKLRGNDHAVYILRHNTLRDHWELWLYDSGQTDATRLSST